MLRYLLLRLSVPALLLGLPAPAPARAQGASDSARAAEVRQAVRAYDAALRRADAAAVERFWAPEFTFVNPRGERLSRAERVANLRAGRTSFDSLAPAPREEQVRVYGDVAVHTTLLTIGGRYGGRAQEGRYRALVVWVRRDGRWQQVANQLTPVLAP